MHDESTKQIKKMSEELEKFRQKLESNSENFIAESIKEVENDRKQKTQTATKSKTKTK